MLLRIDDVVSGFKKPVEKKKDQLSIMLLKAKKLLEMQETVDLFIFKINLIKKIDILINSYNKFTININHIIFINKIHSLKNLLIY